MCMQIFIALSIVTHKIGIVCCAPMVEYCLLCLLLSIQGVPKATIQIQISALMNVNLLLGHPVKSDNGG